MSKVKNFAITIIVPLIVGGIIGLIISKSINYTSLEKPVFSPPAILFPIVWTILYILMGVSYGILRYNKLNDSEIKTIYYLQLFVNAIWPILFFTLNWRLFAFIWIIILDILVIIMTYKFYEKNKLAGLLQIPYLLWSLFASYLNISIYLLNK